MQFFHGLILLFSLCFGLLLGAMDAYFDWMFRFKGNESFLLYLVSPPEPYEIVWRGSFFVLALAFGVFISYIYNKRKYTQIMLDNIFDNVVPMCITNKDYDIIMANNSYYRIFGVPKEEEGMNLKCYEHRPGPQCRTDECPLHVITKLGYGEYTCESTKVEPDKVTRTFIVSATPYVDKFSGKQLGIIECFQEITARKELELEREKLIEKLNNALAEVKELSGFLPICSSCKKVRDDKGYWKQIETYITEHSGTEFSHSICPDCAAKYYEKLSE